MSREIYEKYDVDLAVVVGIFSYMLWNASIERGYSSNTLKKFIPKLCTYLFSLFSAEINAASGVIIKEKLLDKLKLLSIFQS